MKARPGVKVFVASTYMLAALLGIGLVQDKAFAAEVFFNGNAFSIDGAVAGGASNLIHRVGGVRAFRISGLGKCVKQIQVFIPGGSVPTFTTMNPALNGEIPLPPGASNVDIRVIIPDIELQRALGCSPNNGALGIGMMINVVSLAPSR